MRIVNHVLGALAKTNSVLWRHRINFIPLNVALAILLAALGIASLESTVDALRNAEAPSKVSLEQIRANAINQNYVSVSGVSVPEAVYEYGNKGSDGKLTSVDRSWYPLVDAENQRVLLVQHVGPVGGGDAIVRNVEGMLRDLDTSLATKLAAERYEIDGFPVERRYMLVEGERPGSPWLYGIATAAIGGVLACGTIVTVKRNTIFQASGHQVSSFPDADLAEPARVSVTGDLALDEKTVRSFVEMPAMLVLKDGAPVIASNIDASRRFMGFTTTKRSGIWVIAIAAGTVSEGEFGHVFYGLTRRNAFRFSYTDSLDRKKRRAIIASDDPAMLDRAVAMLRPNPSAIAG
ncbi:MAG TPA: hypothetical protein VKB50_11910 [Vicinamibacterales bacterium]|nr:hypothetical protein [Vicinamibacterales bacterium]